MATLAAQVVLAMPHRVPAAAITAANVQSLLPPAHEIERATRAFASLGFTIGPVVGNSFSIEGGVEVFAKAFRTRLVVDHDGTVRDRASVAALTELPLGALSASLRAQLESVLFSAPPAFGPTSP